MITETVDSYSDQALKAVNAFRRLQPTLSAYVRVLTNRSDVSVVMASQDNGSTDGKRIFFRPPIGLGDNTAHHLSECDRRDKNLQLLCQACAIRESVLATIYHEIAHIAFDSFAETTEADKIRLIKEAVDSYTGTNRDYQKVIQLRIEKAPTNITRSYIGLCGLINEFLPIILNALEDARVNRELFKARRGVKIMFDAQVNQIFMKGVEQKTNTGEIEYEKWKDRPLNAQVIVGLFLKTSGYNYSNWFKPVVVKALDDDELTELVHRLDNLNTAKAVYELSFPVLVRLRELGFCATEEDPISSSGETDGQSKEGDSTGEGKSSERSESKPQKGNSGGSDSEDSSNDDSDSKNSKSRSDSNKDKLERNETDKSTEEQSSSGEQSSKDEGGVDGDSSNASGKVFSSPSEESDSSGENKSSGSEPSSPEESRNSKESFEEEESEEEVIDPGADKGEGGTLLLGQKDVNNPELMGSPEDVKISVHKLGDHEEKPKTMQATEAEKAVDIAVIQGMYFETPSKEVTQVLIHEYNNPILTSQGWLLSDAWQSGYTGTNARRMGITGDFTPSESNLGKALLHMRVAFSDNATAKEQRNKKRGKVDARVLGRRVHFDDPRLFKHKVFPGKKDYVVVLGLDVSGSQIGENILLTKQAAFAQAELLHRTGITFAVYAHSGNGAFDLINHTAEDSLRMDIYVIKSPEEPWDPERQNRLTKLVPACVNLDGHTIEFYRKQILDRRAETDKILMYYTDGKMPAENYDEELVILQREIRTFKTLRSRGYTLMAVGIRTDSPIRHGLDTCQINSPDEIDKVVKHLEKRLVT